MQALVIERMMSDIRANYRYTLDEHNLASGQRKWAEENPDRMKTDYPALEEPRPERGVYMNGRKFWWVYSSGDSVEKKALAEHIRQSFGEEVAVVLGGPNQIRNLCTAVRKELMRGWNGMILVLDLTTLAVKETIYEQIASTLDGMVGHGGMSHDGSYNNKMVHTMRHLIVLSSRPPALRSTYGTLTMSKDRFAISRIVPGSTRGTSTLEDLTYEQVESMGR